MGMVTDKQEMKMAFAIPKSKYEISAELTSAVEKFLALGGSVVTIKARKTPKPKTANGKNKGAFNPNRIFK